MPLVLSSVAYFASDCSAASDAAPASVAAEEKKEGREEGTSS